ncbi:MAG: hypothetical protein ACRYFE_12780 [Janthinobacterium lividum]
MQLNKTFYFFFLCLFELITSFPVYSMPKPLFDCLSDPDDKASNVPIIKKERKNSFSIFCCTDNYQTLKEVVVPENLNNNFRQYSDYFIPDIKQYKKTIPVLYYLIKASTENNNFKKWGYQGGFNVNPNFPEAIKSRSQYKRNVQSKLEELWLKINNLNLIPLDIKNYDLNEICQFCFKYNQKFKNKYLFFNSKTHRLDQQKVEFNVYPGFYYLKRLHNEFMKLTVYYCHLKIERKRTLSKSLNETKRHDIQTLTDKIKSVSQSTHQLEKLLDQAEQLGLSQMPLSPVIKTKIPSPKIKNTGILFNKDETFSSMRNRLETMFQEIETNLTHKLS